MFSLARPSWVKWFLMRWKGRINGFLFKDRYLQRRIDFLENHCIELEYKHEMFKEWVEWKLDDWCKWDFEEWKSEQ